MKTAIYRLIVSAILGYFASNSVLIYTTDTATRIGAATICAVLFYLIFFIIELLIDEGREEYRRAKLEELSKKREKRAAIEEAARIQAEAEAKRASTIVSLCENFDGGCKVRAKKATKA